jgi:hypothetical protein
MPIPKGVKIIETIFARHLKQIFFRAGIAQSHRDYVIWAGISRVLIPAAVVRDFLFFRICSLGIMPMQPPNQ